MYITNSLSKFLNDARILSDSTIILTDLDNVVFVASNKSTNYLNKILSEDLKQILKLYINDTSTIGYMNTTMDSILPITLDDDISKYKSQIILPIIHNDIVIGLLIFIADNRKYISSSLKFAKTTQHFTEEFITRAYL